MSRILIIGNGFDLYHKLPTSYLDFLFFAQNWKKFKESYDIAEQDGQEGDALIEVPLGAKNELTIDSLLEFAKHKNIFSREHIEYLDKHIQTNSWYLYFSHIKPDGAKWIDFETEINNALQQVEEYYDLLPTLNSGEALPYLVMSEYMKTVINDFSTKLAKDNPTYKNLSKGLLQRSDIEPDKLRNNKMLLLSRMKMDLDVFNRCLNFYIADFVTHIKCNVYSKQVEDLSDVYLLNFNYTYTYEMVYGKTRMLEHHPVHGEAKEENLVLGISDDAFPDTLDYVYFQKYFQGFFEDINTSKVTIFYHNQQSYEDMVINLVDMFDKDFVIEKTGDGFIEFVLLKSPISGEIHSSLI